MYALLACQPAPRQTGVPSGHAYLEELSVAALRKGYADGTYTIPVVVNDYLARIEALDKNGPRLNAVICVNPDALAIAVCDAHMTSGYGAFAQ